MFEIIHLVLGAIVWGSLGLLAFATMLMLFGGWLLLVLEAIKSIYDKFFKK